MTSTDPFARMGFSVRRVSFWQVALIVTVALAIGTALALVAAGVFLVVFPVVLLSGLAYKLFGSRKTTARAPSGVTVIDAEYRVLSPEEIARDARTGTSGRPHLP